MKFIRNDFGKRGQECTAEEAVQAQLDRETHLCDGTMESLRARVDALQGMVGRLIDRLPEGTKADRDLAAAVIGYAWEPAE